MVEIEIGWILGVFTVLGGAIVSLAGVIYTALLSRIRSQGLLITQQGQLVEKLSEDKDSQNKVIENLQDDIKRLSQGCGIQTCLFKHRSKG